jgi:hypothetical protein
MTLIQVLLAIGWMGLIVLCLHPELGVRISQWFHSSDDDV